MGKWKFVALFLAAIFASGWVTWVRNEPARAKRLMLAQMAAMSTADLSVLKAALARPDSQMMTTAGSANDVLWQQFSHRGWATQLAAPRELPASIRLYSLADKGRTEVLKLFAGLNAAQK
jgi:hypothetical protein